MCQADTVASVQLQATKVVAESKRFVFHHTPSSGLAALFLFHHAEGHGLPNLSQKLSVFAEGE